MVTIGVCVITPQQNLFDSVSSIADRLATIIQGATGRRDAVKPDRPEVIVPFRCNDSAPESQAVLDTLFVQAQRYLQEQDGDFDLRVFYFESMQAFSAAVQASNHGIAEEGLSLEFFFVDASVFPVERTGDMTWAARLKRQLLEICRSNKLATRISPNSFTFYLDREDLETHLLCTDGGHHLRLLDGDRAAQQADMLRMVLDHLEFAYFNRVLRRGVDNVFRPVTLAVEVSSFMQSQWRDNWDFYYFTGSMVAAFIDSMADTTAGTGTRQLTGPNEHSLACGALAGWQLFSRAYVIAVTSGMIDEFKGTLANLQRAKAPGLIICADSPSNAWYAFQGTVNQDGDGRTVAAARGLAYVYIEKQTDLPDRLYEAFQQMTKGAGPVVVFVTQPVLECWASTPLQALPYNVAPNGTTVETDASFEEALKIVNGGDCHILWQCGALSEVERSLAYEIAQRAGIALSDSLTHPGSVASYWNGRKVSHYLGTLAMYAFSRRVYHFLHTDDELNNKDEQCLFFIKSKVDQAATPFSEGVLSRKLRIVQVNREGKHFAPFTDLAVPMSAQVFLERLIARLDVQPAILRKRRAKIAAMNALSTAVPVDYVETIPMAPNYFFHRLRRLVEDLIETQDYRYIGVFDVGRCGLSAVRNMPLTDPGFSGWYGRALMGDALMALPYIALNASGNVLAFVGDGARGVVPDIEIHLCKLLAECPEAKKKNVTVFYLTNGILSVIQTYLDMRFAHQGGSQTRVPSRLVAQSVETFGPLSVHRHAIIDFDQEMLKEAMTEPGRINFFDVLLAHNSSGDGLSLLSEKAWSRQTVMSDPPASQPA